MYLGEKAKNSHIISAPRWSIKYNSLTAIGCHGERHIFLQSAAVAGWYKLVGNSRGLKDGESRGGGGHKWADAARSRKVFVKKILGKSRQGYGDARAAGGAASPRGRRGIPGRILGRFLWAWMSRAHDGKGEQR